VAASPDEHKLVTSKPEELVKLRAEAAGGSEPSQAV